jgi:Spy/CpxP family protein refolding chaperone
MSIRLFLAGLLIAFVTFGVSGQTMKDLPSQDESLKAVQRDLGLSDSQLSRVKELIEARRDRLQSIHQQAKPAFEELLRLLRQPDSDPEAVDKAAVAFRQIHEKAISEQENTEREFLSLLNPQQRKTVNGLRSKDSIALALHRLGLLTPQRSNDQVIWQ